MTDNDLFSKNEPRPWAPRVGVIGSSLDSAACETDAELAFAFRTAADVIAKHWQATGADDSLVLPILFNYRHALELGLKAVIHALIVSTRYELAPGDPEPDLVREISARLGRTHDLKPLVDDLIKLAEQFALQLDANVKMLCEEIHDIDPSGQALRYAVVNPRQPTLARPEPIFVDVPLFVRHAGDACAALDGMLAQIHEMQDWQLDLGPAHSHQTPTQL